MIKTLSPKSDEISIALNTFVSCKEKIPFAIKEKLLQRSSIVNHPINCIQYYPDPIQTNINIIKQMTNWGICYAELLELITASYFNEPDGYVRQFLDTALIAYLPKWLKELIDSYNTSNHLAGAHLGDDNFSGKSIEWNLGAVGGLEEDSGTSEEIANQSFHDIPHHKQNDTEPTYQNTKIKIKIKHSIEAVKDAIYYAYKSHCIANRIPIKSHPCIAYVEHDDIYYSSVRSVKKLRELGVNIHYTFHHTLTFVENHLKTIDGNVIDMLYLDCHLEDLHSNHPIIEAIRNNRVAIDSSPFARLVLRSKVLMALLSTHNCHTALNLDIDRVTMICNNLAYSILLNEYAPLNPNLDQLKQKVVKIAIGSVFGGNGVMVLPAKMDKVNIIKTFKQLNRLISSLATEYYLLDYENIEQFTMGVEIKALFTEIFKTSAKKSSNKKNINFTADYNTNSSLSSTSSFLSSSSLSSISSSLGLSFSDALNDSFKDIKQTFYGKLKQLIKEHFKQYGHIGYKDIEAIIKQTLFYLLDENSVNSKLLERLMVRYQKFFIEKLISQNLPVVVQDFIEPDRIAMNSEEMGIGIESIGNAKSKAENSSMSQNLYISHRIHVFFTEKGKEIFVAGSQIFPITRGKQDNRYKMTCRLKS